MANVAKINIGDYICHIKQTDLFVLTPAKLTRMFVFANNFNKKQSFRYG
jgi:hypothetical protein